MRKIPGIYVEIKGDFSDLKKQLSAAKQQVTEQARGISDALNNALAPEQVKASVNGLIANLGSLSRAAHLSSQDFASLGVDLKEFQSVTGVTAAEFGKLQSRMLETRAAAAQEKSLTNVAKAAGLTRDEIEAMGTQFGLNAAQVDKVTTAIHGQETAVKSLADRIASMPPIKTYTTLAGSAKTTATTQARTGTEGFATNLVAMASGADTTHAAFNLLQLDMDALSKATGLTAEQIGVLKAKFATNSGEQTQANALREIATAAGLTKSEIAALGTQMGVSQANIYEVTTAIHGAAAAMSSLSLEANAGLFSGFKGQVEGFASDLMGIANGTRIAGAAMGGLGADMRVLQQQSGLTEAEFAKLQGQFLQTQGITAQETALKNLATNAGLAEQEMRALGAQMGVSQGSIDNVATSMNEVGTATGFSMAKFRDMIITVALYSVAFQALSETMRAIKDEFVGGLKAVEDFNLTVATSAAFITTFSQKTKSGDLAGAYKDAATYADALAQKLEMVDAQTIASGKDLKTMSETFIQHGVLLDINNKKEVDGFTNIATALALVTAGQNKDIQMRQEINALMTGQARATDRLPLLLKSIDPLLQNHLDTWRKEGTVIENVGRMLAGFSASTGTLDQQWVAVGSTMETIHQRVLRGAFEPIFKELINDAKAINAALMDTDGNMTPLAASMQDIVKGIYESVNKYRDDIIQLFKDMASGAQATVVAVEGVATVLGKIYTTSKDLLGLGLSDMGIIGLVLFGKGAGAAAVMAAILAADNLMDKIDKTDFTKGIMATEEQWLGIADASGKSYSNIDMLKQKLADLTAQYKNAGDDPGALSTFFFGNTKQGLLDQIQNVSNEIDRLQHKFNTGWKPQVGEGISLLNDAYKGPLKNEGFSPAAVMKPDLVPGRAGGDPTASAYNTMLNKQLAYQKAFEETKAAVTKAANALELEKNAEAYDWGLMDYKSYLDNKHKLAEESMQDEIAAKQKELANAQSTLGSLKAITDKSGNPSVEKSSAAQFEGQMKVQKAQKDLIDLQGKYDVLVQKDLDESKQLAYTKTRAYQDIGISLMQMTGQTEAAQMATDALYKTSKEYVALQTEASIDPLAKQALAAADQKMKIQEALARLNEAQPKVQDTASLAERNQDWATYYDQQKKILEIQIALAAEQGKPTGFLKAQMADLLQVNDLTGSLIRGFKDIDKHWSDTAQSMKDVGKKTAEALQSGFSDIFFDGMQGKFKSLGDYINAFMASVERAVADSLSKNLVGNLANSLGGGGGGLGSLLSGIFGGGSSSAYTGGGVTGSPVQSFSMPDLFSVSLSAKGNVFNSPGLSAYSGQVVSQPTYFPFAKGAGVMGEAGPEAIMPLKRGPDGTLGIKGTGGGFQQNVQIINNTDSKVTTQTSQDGTSMTVLIEQLEGQIMKRANRGTGIGPWLKTQGRY